MNHPLRVAVFCGFSEPKDIDIRKDEILFAYRVLQLVDSEALDSTARKTKLTNKELEKIKKEFRQASIYKSPLFGKFNVFGLPPKGKTFAQHLLDELEGDKYDYSIVIMPSRNCEFSEGTSCEQSRTTPFVKMEYALAEGIGKCPVVIIEKGVPDDEVKLVNQPFPFDITKESILESNRWSAIHQRLKQLEQTAIEESKMNFGLIAKVEDFYLRFCRYLLSATKVQIFNHSLLPIGGNYDQNDKGINELLVEEMPLCTRDLYFELEEALLSESVERLNRFLKFFKKRNIGDLKEAMISRVREFDRYREKTFVMKRVVSVPDAAMFGENHVPEKVIQRYKSIYRQIGRIEKRQAESNHRPNASLLINYALAAFQTRTLHPFPTTVHITHEGNAESSIWGFLRSHWEETPANDHFVIARNGSVVKVFEQHVGMFFDGDTVVRSTEKLHEPLLPLLKEEGWTSESVMRGCVTLASLINNEKVCADIAKELNAEFHEPAEGFRNWLNFAANGSPKF